MPEIKQVIKRNGKLQEFNKHKIYVAISAAVLDTYPDCSIKDFDKDISNLTKEIIKKIYTEFGDSVFIEDIQDAIEDELMGYDKFIAKNFITYRYRHALARDRYKILMSDVKDKLLARNVVNQNANVDEKSFGGRKGETTDLVMKRIALEDYLSPKAAYNHIHNIIYTHDLADFAVGSHNCLTIPFDELLANGFNTRQTDVRPAQSVSTAFQLLAVIFQLQSLQQFGGVSAGWLDWTMVPYVRKSFTKHLGDGLAYIEKLSEYKVNRFHKWVENDKEGHPDGTIHFDDKDFEKLHPDAWEYALDMTTREVYQAVEGMYHNLNTLQSRSGNQLPFTSINYGTCTLPEGRLVTKALLDVAIKGIGKFHRTSIFPCCIFQCMRGVNRKKGDPNYDLFRLALKCTALRLYPNYCNVDWSINKGYDVNDPRTYVSTMGCRTYNGADINAEPGTNPQRKDGRGNICPVTIIMPTLAMKTIQKYTREHSTSEHIVDKFLELLDETIAEAKDQLIDRFEWICEQSPDSAKFMYENGLMRGYKPEEGIRSALKHGTLAIGQIGLAETLQILIGKDHTTEEGMKIAKRIEQLFKDRCAEFKTKYKLNFGVYYTPAENLCYTSMKKFKEEYGIIKNVSDKDFFTNSIHVPVWKEISPFEKIDIEAQLTGYSNAGCITYVELESSVKNNIDALETLVNYAMDKDLPYFAINVPNDMCEDCGYADEINDTCPQCGSDDISRLRRVTGYLTGNYKKAFNKGKQQETEMRYKHSKKLTGWRR